MIASFPLRTGILALGTFLASAHPVQAASKTDAPMGWASQNGGTTGGAGGTEVTVTNMADLQKYARTTGKYVIWVSGTMGSYGVRGNGTEDIVTVVDDKSILGLPGAHVKGNITLKGARNVIIRNLTVEGPGACDNDCGTAGESRQDAITIVGGTTNVWLDHLDVFDGEDGNTDITKGSDFVTVSWVKFHYTDKSYPSGTSGKSHRFCNLLGGSDTEDSEGKLSVTFFKTWWGEGVAERMPRVRFGKVHVANCLFNSTDAGQNHCIRAGYKANLLVEGNVFIGQRKPIDLYDNDFTAVTARNNIFTNCSGNTAGSGTAFTPPYTLGLSATSGLQAEITNSTTGAGATLTWGATSVAPAPGREVNPGIRLDRTGAQDVLSNPSDDPAWFSVWNATGRQLEPEAELAPHSSLALATSPAGTRLLRIRTPFGRESRILNLP